MDLNATDFEVALGESVRRVLELSTVPGRRPSHQQPTFWSRPLTPTKIEPVANGGWTNFLVLRGIPGFVYRVSQYVATVYGDAALSSVDFRFVLDGTLPPNMEFASGIDLNKIAVTSFPVVRQSTFFYVGEQNRLILQVRNNNVFQQMVIAGFFGWQYTSADSPQRDSMSVITDDS